MILKGERAETQKSEEKRPRRAITHQGRGYANRGLGIDQKSNKAERSKADRKAKEAKLTERLKNEADCRSEILAVVELKDLDADEVFVL